MKRKFAKIKPSIWRAEKIVSASTNAKLLAFYFMTNEYFEMVGIYRLPRYFMSKDTGLSEEEARVALSELIEIDFCHYHDDSEVVWVVDMAVSQVADDPNEKQLIGVVNELRRLHYEYEYPFVEGFLSKHAHRFKLPTSIDEF